MGFGFEGFVVFQLSLCGPEVISSKRAGFRV